MARSAFEQGLMDEVIPGILLTHKLCYNPNDLRAVDCPESSVNLLKSFSRGTTNFATQPVSSLPYSSSDLLRLIARLVMGTLVELAFPALPLFDIFAPVPLHAGGQVGFSS